MLAANQSTAWRPQTAEAVLTIPYFPLEAPVLPLFSVSRQKFTIFWLSIT